MWAFCWEITHLTQSPIEISPTGSDPSSTGRWRIRLSVITRMQSATLVDGSTVITGRVSTSATAVSRGALFGSIALLLGAVAAWLGGRMGAVDPTLAGGTRPAAHRERLH